MGNIDRQLRVWVGVRLQKYKAFKCAAGAFIAFNSHRYATSVCYCFGRTGRPLRASKRAQFRVR